jgi:hypothetical protein
MFIACSTPDPLVFFMLFTLFAPLVCREMLKIAFRTEDSCIASVVLFPWLLLRCIRLGASTMTFLVS